MMKALRMNKVISTFKRKTNGGGSSSDAPADSRTPGHSSRRPPPNGTGNESPEEVANLNVRAFCESGGPNSDDEILFLPPIVDAAESSPKAAAECARLVRKYLKKEYSSRPSYQYNAIMLVRILSDNPGPTFTRNLDDRFIEVARNILKAKDPSVRQIMMETLDAFEHTKAYDEGLAALIAMWQREKASAMQRNPDAPYPPPHQQHSRLRTAIMPQNTYQNPQAQQYPPARNSRRLPDPVELANRLEEARTSANMLQEMITHTPPSEVLGNELIQEFSERCNTASKSIQGYMSADDPAPDNDTMESLIDTNEALQASLSLHQRAVLNAKKQAGIGNQSRDITPPPVVAPNGSSQRRQSLRYLDSESDEEHQLAPTARPSGNGKGKGREYEPMATSAAGPSRHETPSPIDDPFADPEPEAAGGSGAGKASASRQENTMPSPLTYEPDDSPLDSRLAFEPFNPGFQSASQGASGASGGGSGSAAPEPAAKTSSRADVDDDIHEMAGSSSAQKQPVYRY